MKGTTYWLGLLAALLVPSAQAANKEIRMVYQPDSAQPAKNVFINKTPNGGFCAADPAQCAASRMASIQIPTNFYSVRTIEPGVGLSFTIPTDWRQLTVTNKETQKTETVEVRIAGIGSFYALSHPASQLVGVSDELEGHQKLWTTSSWNFAPSPCQYTGYGSYGPETYRFFWKTPVGPCAKVNTAKIPGVTFYSLDVGYEVRTPNPLSMSSGLYTGALSYTLGPGGDFEVGPWMYPNDTNLTFDVVLDVQHTLKVDLPPGGDKVVLEPEGGWQRWLSTGEKPNRIYRDQPFHISTSSPFKVMMLCDSYGGSECKMLGGRGSGGYTVEIFLPPGITGPGGSDGQALTHNVWTGPFEPSHYVDRKPGRLRFEMTRRSIDWEFQPGHFGTYRSTVTVIWDSEV